jgi:hypothetical protein
LRHVEVIDRTSIILAESGEIVNATLFSRVSNCFSPWFATYLSSPLTPRFSGGRLDAMFVTCPLGMSISVVPVSERNPAFFAKCPKDRCVQVERSEFPHDTQSE